MCMCMSRWHKYQDEFSNVNAKNVTDRNYSSYPGHVFGKFCYFFFMPS
jgi:hypothetical protein